MSNDRYSVRVLSFPNIRLLEVGRLVLEHSVAWALACIDLLAFSKVAFAWLMQTLFRATFPRLHRVLWKLHTLFRVTFARLQTLFREFVRTAKVVLSLESVLWLHRRAV